MAGSLYERVNPLPILQHPSPMLHVDFNFHATENTARHIAMGRLRDGLSPRF